jgi:AcrR family transcriptional regulator
LYDCFIPVKKLFAKKIVWKVGDILNLANFIPSNFRKTIIFGYKKENFVISHSKLVITHISEMQDKIRKSFVEYVLEHNQRPTSVYLLAKRLKMKEQEFYEHFNSLRAIEDSIWSGFLAETKEKIESEEVYAGYSVREKLLAFYFTWLEVLKENRSYAMWCFESLPKWELNPSFLQGFKKEFEDYAASLMLEGRESQEVQERALLHNIYPKAFTAQVIAVLKFWVRDTSPNFEKTDVFVEKSVNLAFDLIGRTALDSAFDFLKFVWQNK